MPNWCGNTLTLTHEDPDMIRRAKAAFAEGTFLQEFIPNPKGEWEYDWSVANWGTKWDIGEGAGIQTWDDHELVVYFDSAWSPPISAYEKLEDLGFKVNATYYEGGCAFCGTYEDGYNDHYDLGDMSAEEVANTIPKELDESFGISEVMLEYEAEQQDEVTTWYKDGVEETGLEPHKVKKETK